MQRVLFLLVALVNCNLINAMQKPKLYNPSSLKDFCAKVILKEHTDLNLINCNQDIKAYLRARQAKLVSDLMERCKTPIDALKYAIIVNVNAAIIPLIHLGVEINPKSGPTPLMEAVERRNLQACQQLLLAGSDPNAYDDTMENGFTVLTHAIIGLSSEYREYFEQGMRILKLLLASNALVDKPNRWGEPALSWAFKKKHWKTVVSCLLEHGANINKRDNSGRTPLMYAVQIRKGRAARYLISRGALIDPIDKYGQNAFMYACAYDASRKVIRKLLDMNHALIKMQDKKGNTALHLAIENKRRKAVKLLLLHGAPIDVRNTEGETPLDIAKRKRFEQVVTVIENFTAKK